MVRMLAENMKASRDASQADGRPRTGDNPPDEPDTGYRAVTGNRAVTGYRAVSGGGTA
jgi:hypothetical protein